MTKDLDKKVAHAMKLHYERGFIDGMQKQAQSSVDKAVNAMSQRTEQNFCSRCGKRTKDSTHIHTCTPPHD